MPEAAVLGRKMLTASQHLLVSGKLLSMAVLQIRLLFWVIPSLLLPLLFFLHLLPSAVMGMAGARPHSALPLQLHGMWSQRGWLTAGRSQGPPQACCWLPAAPSTHTGLLLWPRDAVSSGPVHTHHCQLLSAEAGHACCWSEPCLRLLAVLPGRTVSLIGY